MLIIGHRGARGLAPENTIAGFQAALDHKVDAIELDVRTTKDQVAVLCHDPKIGKAAVSKTDFKELKQLKPDLITLEEGLRFIKNRVAVIIEVKPGATLEPIVICIEARLRNGLPEGSLTISSFDFKALKQIKKLLPNITLAVNEKWSGVRASHRARKLGTKFITMNQRWLWSGFIRSVARSGYKLTAYTVNNPAKAQKWTKHGLYAVVTDFPDQFKKV